MIKINTKIHKEILQFLNKSWKVLEYTDKTYNYFKTEVLSKLIELNKHPLTVHIDKKYPC